MALNPRKLLKSYGTTLRALNCATATAGSARPRVLFPVARHFSSSLHARPVGNAPTSPPSGSSSTPDGSSPSSKTLATLISDSIKAAGPLPISTYMRTCLLDPSQGYYAAGGVEGREVLGARGDFITSPEISQVFGELLAIYFVSRWQAAGKPSNIRLVELGPGRGTLLSDMLRTFATFPSMFSSLNTIQLVETSEGMMERQRDAVERALEKAGKKLARGEDGEGVRLEWYGSIEGVPVEPDTWTMLAAHEFFDALPTHIFEKTTQGFREVMVDIKREGQSGITVLKPSDITAPSSSPAPAKAPEFRYVLSPSPTPWSTLLAANNPRFQSLQPGQRVEISPESWAAARRVGELVAGREAARPKGLGIDRSEEEEQRRETERKAQPGAGGAAIVVDYGDEKAFGGSFRAFKAHQIVDPLENPGTADLTVNVDFIHLKHAISSTDARPLGPMTQAHFLASLGLQQRVEALLRSAASDERRSDIQSAARRLVDLTGMGAQYKVLGIEASPTQSVGAPRADEDTLPPELVYPFESS